MKICAISCWMFISVIFMNINKTKNIHHKFLFQDTYYLWSHFQVRLDEVSGVVTLFFYFSCVYACGRTVPLGTLSSPSIGFNLMTNFSGTSPDRIPSIWLIFQVPDRWNSIDLVIEISKRSTSPPTLSTNRAELHFCLLGHRSNEFQGEKLKK